MRDLDLADLKRKRKENEQVEGVMKALSQLINGMSSERLAELMFEHLKRDHRTLQQDYIRSLQMMLEQYGKEAQTDLRNEGAKAWCKAISEIPAYLPRI